LPGIWQVWTWYISGFIQDRYWYKTGIASGHTRLICSFIRLIPVQYSQAASYIPLQHWFASIYLSPQCKKIPKMEAQQTSNSLWSICKHHIIMNESSLLPDLEGTYFKKKNCTHLGKSSWESCREVFTPSCFGKEFFMSSLGLIPKTATPRSGQTFPFLPLLDSCLAIKLCRFYIKWTKHLSLVGTVRLRAFHLSA
jgi:hypothetical protein